MQIGVLSLQGAFLEHEQMLKKLGIGYFEIRSRRDIAKPFDGLILPGGESTAQGLQLKDTGLFTPLQKMINSGLPVLATCAGLILLADRIEGEETSYFRTLPVTVKRNAYGRQLGSFYTRGTYGSHEDIPMTFIRAPYITDVQPGVEVLSTVDDHIVAVRYKNQTALSFHPELNDDLTIYQEFLAQIAHSSEAGLNDETSCSAAALRHPA